MSKSKKRRRPKNKKKTAVKEFKKEMIPEVEKPLHLSPSIGEHEIRPLVGFKPRVPHEADGILIEPPPSFACAIGTILDATDAADPPLEPPDVHFKSQGFLVGRKAFGSVVTINPNSGVADFPQIIEPVEMIFFVILLLYDILFSLRKLLPCIIGNPLREASKSFRKIGTP